MSPVAAFFLILVAIATAVLLVGFAAWLLTRNAGVRRREYAAMRTERNLAWRALGDIEDAALQYADIDSVLAARIKTIIRTHNTEKMEITR